MEVVRDICLGKFQVLKIMRFAPPGAYLSDLEGKEVLLPNRYVPAEAKEEDVLNVFIYQDHEHRLTAITEQPKLTLDEVAYLQVKDTTGFGAFLDWGLPKDLFVPNKEQKVEMQDGKFYFVRLMIDQQTGRLQASAKIKELISRPIDEDLKQKKEVDVQVYRKTPMGYEVIIERKYLGLLYQNEIFEKLSIGTVKKAFIQKIREDGKIDLRLQPSGYVHIDLFAEKILEKIKTAHGFLPLTDYSDPLDIQKILGMSKKNFKKAIGSLLKAKKIQLKDDGVYWV